MQQLMPRTRLVTSAKHAHTQSRRGKPGQPPTAQPSITGTGDHGGTAGLDADTDGPLTRACGVGQDSAAERGRVRGASGLVEHQQSATPIRRSKQRSGTQHGLQLPAVVMDCIRALDADRSQDRKSAVHGSADTAGPDATSRSQEKPASPEWTGDASTFCQAYPARDS